MNLEHIVVIDFETTGLSCKDNRTIEVGAVALDGNRLTGEFSQLMYPGDFLPYHITQITGITDEMLQAQPSPEEVMPDFYEFIGQRSIIAHNAGFDLKFLNSEFSRVGLKAVNPVFCTLKLARRLMPGLPRYSLSSLKEHLDIRVDKAHRALDDARATAFLWRHLMKEFGNLFEPEVVGAEALLKIMNSPQARVQKLIDQKRSAPSSSF